MDPFAEDSLRKGHRLAVYMCCAMIASVFIYAGVAEMVAAQNAPFHGYAPVPAAVYGKLRLILLIIALVDFALIPYIRSRALTSRRRSRAAYASSLPESVQRFLAASIVSFALCESIAIYGLVLFLMNGRRPELYLFIAISLAAFVLHFPRFERWREWAEAESPMGGSVT